MVKNGLLQRRAVPMARRSPGYGNPILIVAEESEHQGPGEPVSGYFFQASDLSRSHVDVIGRPIDFRITKASHTPTTHITV